VTLVVGTPTKFGYGFGILDIRITLGYGSEADCLQKIFPVGRWVAAGFAGSVQIGVRPDRQPDSMGQCDSGAVYHDSCGASV
jgi:hypothetical protein